jgi:tetratricopeptide (TPR) repeat protein
MSKASSMFVDPKWAQEFLAKHGPSPGNRLAASLPRASAAGAGSGREATGSAADSRAAWAAFGPWSDVGALISAERSQEAIAKASQMLLTNPEDPRGYFLRGLAYFLQGDNEFAEANFDDAIGLQTDNGEVLAYRGYTRERAGRYDDAESDLTNALALGVEMTGLFMDRLQGTWNTSVYRRRAAVLVALDRPGEALADLERAMALEPENQFLYVDRAKARLAAGQLEPAYDDAMTLAGLLPQMPFPYDLMGQVRWWQGRYDQAAGLHQRALDRTTTETGQPGAGRGEILAHLAAAERMNGDPAGAMRHLEEAIELRQDHPAASDYLLLGTLFHEAGRTAEAAGAFRRAASLDPEIVAGNPTRDTPAGAADESLAFIRHERTLATSYVGSGTNGGPALTAPSKSGTTIHDVAVNPSPVAAGEPFDFVIDYTASDPAMPAGPIPLQLVVEIIQNGEVVFTVPEKELSADNGSRSSWVQHMNPTTAVGSYTVRVFLASRGGENIAETSFSIE